MKKTTIKREDLSMVLLILCSYNDDDLNKLNVLKMNSTWTERKSPACHKCIGWRCAIFLCVDWTFWLFAVLQNIRFKVKSVMLLSCGSPFLEADAMACTRVPNSSKPIDLIMAQMHKCAQIKRVLTPFLYRNRYSFFELLFIVCLVDIMKIRFNRA